ncbi:predicted protein [Sclerotinia sclerotiorum 1980 UF-70]|uniref:Uncharacterized protein n=1 Tax=Sclerotinia sclerotiorum (strain ATCC 18683 / 1980 / Ss-1) TaxID=665079 RepID=A7EQQ9_SCLS1|nr:predicted protein [Sclerotinia sclerotiorum 1980 UF-70]EDN91801.1 predicted protein [Sclerotinia sclerotiorum 1980 UF-70]
MANKSFGASTSTSARINVATGANLKRHSFTQRSTR